MLSRRLGLSLRRCVLGAWTAPSIFLFLEDCILFFRGKTVLKRLTGNPLYLLDIDPASGIFCSGTVPSPARGGRAALFAVRERRAYVSFVLSIPSHLSRHKQKKPKPDQAAYRHRFVTRLHFLMSSSRPYFFSVRGLDLRQPAAAVRSYSLPSTVAGRLPGCPLSQLRHAQTPLRWRRRSLPVR